MEQLSFQQETNLPTQLESFVWNCQAGILLILRSHGDNILADGQASLAAG